MEEKGFCCPVCAGALRRQGQSLVCEKGHSYDIAKQGYVNLLTADQMHSKTPGDTKEMVASRRRFLEAGYYKCFQDELCKLIKEYAPADAVPMVLDAGCGEGTYTGSLKAALPRACVLGTDISKAAVKAAAGKYKEISFAVASNFSLPLPADACDILVNVFSPLASAEFARVVKPGGIFLYAVPGERHLFGLKEILYEAPYENPRRDTEYPGFVLAERRAVRGVIFLPDGAAAMDLFAMTPYYWKTGVDGGRRLRETKGFSTEIAFDFLVYRRVRSPAEDKRKP